MIKRATIIPLCILAGCSQPVPIKPQVPALDYARRIQADPGPLGSIKRLPPEARGTQSGPLTTMRTEQYEIQKRTPESLPEEPRAGLGEMPQMAAAQPGYGPVGLNPRDYNGPLSLGDPGVAASLWRDSSGTPDFFRDVRAWQPMDLLTIVVSESAEGKKSADTEVKEESTVEAAIENLLGFEADVSESNPNIDLKNLIRASTTNDFKGEGTTNRSGELTGTISAMIAEVLPSGILRIEGTKIISVNSEEQVMVISGLVRPRDITSENTIESSRIANVRIDYFGNGEIGDVQHQGWLQKLMRKIWPF